ncbi:MULTISPECIES: ArsR/SmtB family transcription factor [Kordiimonas]|jgi:DNA-binding transcriptional ArsR family regulator|uniref:ArsR/SmtB family transcription factor n=1 Tax=Kordiimonas TaxID=288021 RepID=UPI00257FD768|nr:metalloregulator ArsR/SmtB family transcription factor [Kordiimonas sp. UBA4487]
MNRDQLIDFFKALASDTRQAIIVDIFLDGEEHSVSAVAKEMDIAISTASHHLKELKRVGILVSRKEGKDVLYKGDREFMVRIFSELADRFRCC